MADIKRRRNTWQREAVRAALAEVRRFVSAQELHRMIVDNGSAIGLATVYRTLGTLVEAGEADQVQAPEGESLFRLCSAEDHHHHLICRRCGRTEELEALEVEAWANRVASDYGFTQIEHVVDLFGLCKECTRVA